jgi:hypothetical protein
VTASAQRLAARIEKARSIEECHQIVRDMLSIAKKAKKDRSSRRRDRTTRAPDLKPTKGQRAATKAEKRRAVYDVVDTRASGYCEACFLEKCAAPGVSRDHFWGRAREESVESVWKLCFACDRAKTENKPTRIWWLEKFRAHAVNHRYWEQAAKCSNTIGYELAQHPEHAPTVPVRLVTATNPCRYGASVCSHAQCQEVSR